MTRLLSLRAEESCFGVVTGLSGALDVEGGNTWSMMRRKFCTFEFPIFETGNISDDHCEEVVPAQ